MAKLHRGMAVAKKGTRSRSRKHPAHGVHLVEGQPTIVFGTVCTRNREPWLATPENHAALREAWTIADAWLTGRYVMMPDHVHFFAGWSGADVTFDRWVTYWKSLFKRSIQNADFRWQSDHWDTRIRNGKSYEEKWDYVQLNPVRHGLVASPDDWPYRGEIHSLPWD